MKNRQSLFGCGLPPHRLHPSFVSLISKAPHDLNSSARKMLNDAFLRFPDRDENFVEQFQTTGFNNRVFELYVSEVLHSEGFAFRGSAAQPDFHVEKDGLKVFIECTTTNPTMTGDGPTGAYRTLPDGGLDHAAVAARREDAAIRVAGALRSKMLHRVGKREKKAYWELPHVEGHPFILAVETFHANGALAMSSSSLAEYLYGMRWTPSWDESGALMRSDNQDENRATIRMRMRRRGGDEGRA